MMSSYMLLAVASALIVAPCALKDDSQAECIQRNPDSPGKSLEQTLQPKSQPAIIVSDLPKIFKPAENQCTGLGCDFSVASEPGCQALFQVCDLPKGKMDQETKLGVCNVCDSHYIVPEGTPQNEDAWLVHCVENQCVYADADGHGSEGHHVSAGFMKLLYQKLNTGQQVDPKGEWIQNAVDAYDKDEAYEFPQGSCTLAGAAVKDGAVHVFHAGRSRVLVADDKGTLVYNTTDHTWALKAERDRADEIERERASKAGETAEELFVFEGKVLSSLKIQKGDWRLPDSRGGRDWRQLIPSRGIGDIATKKARRNVNQESGYSKAGYSSMVDYVVLPETPRVGKIIIGCEGVFDGIASKVLYESRLYKGLNSCKQDTDNTNGEVLGILKEQDSNARTLVDKSREAMIKYTKACAINSHADDATAIVVNLAAVAGTEAKTAA